MNCDDICLHVSVRPTENMVELNTCSRGGWEYGTQVRSCPVRLGQAFELMVLVEEYNYKVQSPTKDKITRARDSSLGSCTYIPVRNDLSKRCRNDVDVA